MQPATVPAVPTQISVTISDQTHKFPGYCALRTPTGKQYPKECPMSLKSDSEQDGNATNKENKGEEGIEYQDGNIQKQKDMKRQEFKNNNITPPTQTQNPH